MAAEYKLSYTAEEIDRKLGLVDKIENKPTIIEAELVNANKAISTTTGEDVSTSYGMTTDYIELKDAKHIEYYSGNGNNTICGVAFYDDNHIFLPEISKMGGGSLGITCGLIDLTSPIYQEAKYVRFTYYHYPNKDFEHFIGVIEYNNNLAGKISEIEKDYGKGLNILVFGDSITDCCNITIENDVTTQYSFIHHFYYTDADGNKIPTLKWPEILNKKMLCKEMRNYALSGATYKDAIRSTGNERQNLSYQVSLALNDLNNVGGAFLQDVFDPDVVIFALGTNDGNPNDTPESAFEKMILTETGIDIDATLENLNRENFCEAVLWSYLKIKVQFPLSLCFTVLPLQRMSDDFPTGNMRKYMQEIANKCGIIVIDGAYESGIIKANNFLNSYGETLVDGLHPNAKGHNLMARMIISAIKQHYVSFDGMNKC